MHDYYTLMFCFCLTATNISMRLASAVNNNQLKSSFCSLVTEEKMWSRHDSVFREWSSSLLIYMLYTLQDFFKTFKNWGRP